jgi:hypothetical protein
MDQIGVFDTGATGAAIEVSGFFKLEGRTVSKLILPRSEGQIFAVLLFMRSGLQSRACNYTVAHRGSRPILHAW